MNDVLAGHLTWINRFLLTWIERFPSGLYLERIDGRANCVTWQAGHIAGSRRAVARQIDCGLATPEWLELFGRGSSGDPAEGWPDLSVIVEDLQATADRLCGHLRSVEPTFMAEEVTHVLSDGRVRRAENVAFFLYHEGFHAGQIEQARRLLEG